MRDALTTAAEIAGALCIVTGCLVLFGIGVTLMVAGAGLLAIGYLASGGASE